MIFLQNKGATMTLQRAAWLAQLMRKWGFSALLEYNERTGRYRVFATGGRKPKFVTSYADAVNYR